MTSAASPANPEHLTSAAIRLRSSAGRMLLDVPALTWRAGTHTAVIGASGAGKSLFLKALFGELGGAATFSPAVGGYYMIQDPGGGLTPALTVAEHFHELGLGGTWRTQAAAVLADLDLDAATLLPRFPAQLSGGQRQRVMLALILVRRPRWLVCDEPAASLDRVTERRTVALLKHKAQAYGFTLIFVTHQVRLLAEMADQVLLLDRGALVFQGDRACFLNQPTSAAHQHLVNAWRRLQDRATAVVSAPTAEGEPVLNVSELTVGYGKQTLVRDWSFALQPGRLHWVAAPSGSGKTTVARALTGFPAQAFCNGRMWLDGRPAELAWRRRDAHSRHAVVWLFQHGYEAFNPLVPMARQWRRLLRDGAARQGRAVAELEQEFAALTAALGLAELDFSRLPASFSLGERQRCQLVRALLLRPRVVIGDELLSALDVPARVALTECLRQYAATQAAAVMLFSHDLDLDGGGDVRLAWPQGLGQNEQGPARGT